MGPYVSASESQERPRSYSLLPKSFAPVMVLGLAREMMLPTRVGILSVCAAARVAQSAVMIVDWKCMMWEFLVIYSSKKCMNG